MITYITVFLLKALDCAMGTLKTVFLIKNKNFMSSIMNALSCVFFVMVASITANTQSDNRDLLYVTIFFANLVGSYCPTYLMSKFEKDRLFVYVITSQTFDSGTRLADRLRSLHIPITTTVDYLNTEKVLTIKAFAETKEQSTVIDNMLVKGYKYHVIQAI